MSDSSVTFSRFRSGVRFCFRGWCETSAHVYSVRMEYFRDGVEDFNLMGLVKKLPERERRRVEQRIAEISSDKSALLADPVRVAAVRPSVSQR